MVRHLNKKIHQIKAQERRIKRRKQFAAMSIAAALVLLVGAVILAQQEFVRVQYTRISGHVTIPTDDLEATIQTELTGSWLGLIPRENIFLLSRDRLSARLLESFPDLSSATVEITRDRDLEITVTEHDPQYLWCQSQSAKALDPFTSCYFVNRSGIIFADAPYFSDGVLVTFFGGSIANPDQPLDQRFILSEQFTTITETINTLRHLRTEVSSVYLTDEGNIELHLRRLRGTRVNSDSRIIMDFDNNPAQVAEHVALTVQVEDFIERTKDSSQRLDYIDVRFHNRILYRFK